jgi:hypothetical protein
LTPGGGGSLSFARPRRTVSGTTSTVRDQRWTSRGQLCRVWELKSRALPMRLGTRGPLAETRGRCSARGGGSGWGSRTRMSNCATFGMLHASGPTAWRARYGMARLGGYSSGWFGDGSAPEDHRPLHDEVDARGKALRDDECQRNLADHRWQQPEHHRVHPDLGGEGDSVQHQD